MLIEQEKKSRAVAPSPVVRLRAHHIRRFKSILTNVPLWGIFRA